MPALRRHPRVVINLFCLGALACAAPQAPISRAPRYVPRVRDLTITTVPLLVKEMRAVLPFLGQAFGPGGILADKEVYAFVPNHLTVGEGDTLHFTFYNPEDDAHSFILPPLAVPLPGETITRATYVARSPGLLTFVCSVPKHLPMMQGQLVVLPGSVMAQMTLPAEAPGAPAP
jgi:plastocyanin